VPWFLLPLLTVMSATSQWISTVSEGQEACWIGRTVILDETRAW